MSHDRARSCGARFWAVVLTILGWGEHAIAAPWERSFRRYVARTENAGERMAASLAAVAGAWLWILSSLVGFATIALAAAVADRHMLSLLRNGIGEFLGYAVRSGWTVLRVFCDRQTPRHARLVLLPGLMYWLLPFDLLADDSLTGLFDDSVVAAVCGRWFVRLAPDGVILKHAAGLQPPSS